MKKIIIGAISLAVMLAGLVAAPVGAVKCPAGAPVAEASSYAECNLAKPEDGSKSLWDTVDNIINIILAVLGIAAVVVIIYGGANILLSQGDPGKIKKGKDAILYGLIGLVIALLAFAIVNFVLSGVFGGGETSGTGDAGGGSE